MFLETTEEDPGRGMTRLAVDTGVGLVIAVGGDGTVRSVAQGLLGTTIPMGVVPLGTGNLLARNLDIPLNDLDAALGVAMGGRSRSIDVGRVEYTDGEGTEHSTGFLVMLGAGMDADMIAGTDDSLKARVGWIAYVSSFMNTLLKGHRIRVEYSIDGDEHRLHQGAHPARGELRDAPGRHGAAAGRRDRRRPARRAGPARQGRPRVDAGRVRVGRAHDPPPPAGHPPARGRARAGAARHAPLDFRQGNAMRATVLEKPATFQIDGEDAGDVTEFSARIRRRALTVRVGF